MRTREETWQALDHGFKTFMDCLGQLTEDELTSTPVVGNWTVKDVVVHVWLRADEALHTAKAWDGPRPWQTGVSFDDDWNETQVADRRALPLITVVDNAYGAHRRLMHFIDLSDAATLARVGGSPWGDTMTMADFLYDIAEHYVVHADQLKLYQTHCLECD
jgi:hypothetical protein